ncbi:hypothetical protein, conserved [Leishmania tarentolae]|uniref:Uncharacterized protein n=1 Tax=Leishmania tarentolae TaxID=5689 RepID=A0A640K7L2_LEITA|nr:hypothetical protein, conserved [Leishmania tarentolae]
MERAGDEHLRATVGTSVVPMEVRGQGRVEKTASRAAQVGSVTEVHADHAALPSRGIEDEEHYRSSSADGDASEHDHRADGGGDVEEDEDDIVVDELDLYCSTQALLYQRPVTDIIGSHVTANSCPSLAKVAVSAAPPACASATSALSTASCKAGEASLSADKGHKDEDELLGERGVVRDVEGSEVGDRHVTGDPSHAHAATFVHLDCTDNSEQTVSFEGRDAAAPIVTSSRGDYASGGQCDGVAGHARVPVEAKVQQSSKLGNDDGNVDAGVCSPVPSPSQPASECRCSSSPAQRQGWRSGRDHGRGCGGHVAGAGESSGGDASASQGEASTSTLTGVVDTQAPRTPRMCSSAVVAAATLPPVRRTSETEDAPYTPPLMDELDGELLQLIKAYYVRRQSTSSTATAVYASLPSQAAASSSAVAPTYATGHALHCMKSGRSSESVGGSGVSRFVGTATAAEMRGSRGGSEAPHDACLLPHSFTASHAAGAAAALDEASQGGLQELRGHHAADRPSPYAIRSSDDAAALASSAETGLRLGEDVLYGPPSRIMSRLSAHDDGTRVGFGAAAAASSFSVQQHTSPSADSLYDPMTLGEASRGQHRAATASGATTFAERAATLHYQTHGGTNISGSAGAGGALSSGIASSLSALSSLPSYSSTSFVRAYVSDISLSLEPAIIVSALTAALNIVVVYFLQQHVLDTRDHLGLFLIGSYMIFASYYMIYYFLERFSDSFRRIASQDKKFYIIGNLIKAGILISITPFACVHLVKIIVFEEWESNILRNLGCIYAIPDFISMVIVRRMRWSTWIHHACVVLFNYFSIMNNYQHENVCRCVVVYAAFSSFAYCVNVLLASRFLGVSANVARVLSFVALVVYALCCAVNWAWQVYYLRRLLISGHDHWTVYVYMLLISLVMWDDIVLNSWLLHHARNNAYVASQHLQQQQRTRQQQQQQPLPASSRMASTRLSQRLSPLYRSQDTRTVYRAPPLPPTGLPPRAP